MKKVTYSKPTRVNDTSFDDLFEDMSSNWQLKAERLVRRRERKLRHQMLNS